MLQVGIFIAVVFIGGFGWGQWWAERIIRKERSANEQGRIIVSMPIDKNKAAAAMEMAQDFIDQVLEDS